MLYVAAGLTDRLDVTAFVPFVKVAAASQNRYVCCQGPGSTSANTQGPFRTYASSSGIGDVAVRGKYRVLEAPVGALAFLAEVRIPTGDVENLTGLGKPQGRVGAVFSSEHERFGPHLSVSYASTPSTEVQLGPASVFPPIDLPRQTEFAFALGSDVTPIPTITASADLLYRHLPFAGRLSIQEGSFSTTLMGMTRRLTEEDVGASFWSLGAAVKVNVVRTLLIGGAVHVSLNEAGLRDKITPSVQIEYSF
jgi:hypothetical protein